MEINELYEKFGCDTEQRRSAIFSSFFILQNRMQTAGEKLQTEISMKQWLLLAMVGACPEPRTLTRVGQLMGCSRQNVKKLALALEKKGFARLLQSANNSVLLETTDAAEDYAVAMQARYAKALDLLFEDFSEDEIGHLYRLYAKLYKGIERVEKYVEE